ncbi:unnamed protein product [Lasius platythorax]
MTKAFSAPILLDNFLLGFIDNKRDKECLKQDPFHYIRTLLY